MAVSILPVFCAWFCKGTEFFNQQDWYNGCRGYCVNRTEKEEELIRNVNLRRRKRSWKPRGSSWRSLPVKMNKLKRKVNNMWDQDHMRRAKAAKVEQSRRERTEADIRRRVQIEEYERDRVRNEIWQRWLYRRREKGWK